MPTLALRVSRGLTPGVDVSTAPAAPNLGQKFTCFKCECKFYDLGREEPLCPRCGADQREDPNPDPREAFLARFRKPSRSRSRAKPVKEKPARTESDEEDDEPGEEDDEELLDDDFAGGDKDDDEEEEEEDDE